jgi:hypothetical protein
VVENLTIGIEPQCDSHYLIDRSSPLCKNSESETCVLEVCPYYVILNILVE